MLMTYSHNRPESDNWFRIGLAIIFLLSLFLRFWGLGRFNTFVFDEVYYAKFANNYLTNTQFFNAHPPLSQYIIAVGIWLGSHLPFGQDTINNLTGSVRSTWSYRWINAFTGSFIPLVIAAIAYQISNRRNYALIAALFAATDGLFLVESRYALNNIYLVIFGLLGQLFLLLGLKSHNRKRSLFLALAGVWFGASAAIKWNGLWFLLGAYLIWLAAWVISWVKPLRNTYATRPNASPLQNLTQLKIGHILVYLAIIPVAVYSLAWIPHLQQNPKPNFWEMQYQILSYHERIGDGANVHPYCSDWYTWLFMLRPVAYFYKTASSTTEPLSFTTPALPAGAAKIIYDVHAMGNPALWWLSTAAIFYMLWLLLRHSWTPKTNIFSQTSDRHITDNWIVLYLTLNWLANLLPWVPVTRCVFIYHYMGASVFSGLAIAFFVDRWLESYRPQLRALGVTIIFVILAAFVFWMPIYLGLPLSLEAYRLRLPYFNYAQLPAWVKQFLPNWI
ncbi:dolichyl-phosphate-mannose--protein O-mannosyl transferase [Aliterella atlantica CENA595]|uniref:Polyprenol-phosphate-mannose--protein mannosyltransferase n=2 Tax=Aliterella TaxID=1827277 RepID=A0A0D8ZS43_9CYAN|nr:dolichyl-phosphate-mannose--protein O-mannosyl transferase [Aliterella atlantica CENA595]